MMHRSRWGWHPCDYETCRLLKRVHAYCLQARRGFAEWQRWRRKQPQNRVIREPVRDEQGSKVATRVVGPWPEPVLCPVFCTKAPRVAHAGPIGDGVLFCDHGIPEAYRAARTPLAGPEKVRSLSVSSEELRRLLARLEGPHGERKG
jgi:hypothetical protein